MSCPTLLDHVVNQRSSRVWFAWQMSQKHLLRESVMIVVQSFASGEPSQPFVVEGFFGVESFAIVLVTSGNSMMANGVYARGQQADVDDGVNQCGEQAPADPSCPAPEQGVAKAQSDDANDGSDDSQVEDLVHPVFVDTASIDPDGFKVSFFTDVMNGVA